MLAAVLLALVGVGFLLLGRAWVTDSADRKLVQRLVDLAVRDPTAARALLREHPELREARYLHDQTPLHYCAAEGLADGVRFLADAGIPVDARNAFGDTALVDVVAQGNVEVTRLLLRLGADPNVVSRPRGCVLHIAVGQGSPEVVTALLRAGARADYVTDQGERIWDALPKEEVRRGAMLRVLEAQGVGPP